MKERLILFLKHLGIGQLAFEENVGLSRGYVNKVGDNITLRSLDKIEASYPELNINWLKTGTGEMLKTEAKAYEYTGSESIAQERITNYEVTQIIEPQNEKVVPYYLYKEQLDENKELIKEIARLELLLKQNGIDIKKAV